MRQTQYQGYAEPPRLTAVALTPLSWQPHKPDEVGRRRPGLATSLIPVFAGVFALAQLAVPANAWEGRFPARLERQAGLPTEQQRSFAWQPQTPAAAAPGVFNAQPVVRAGPRQTEGRFALVIRSEQFFVPALSWESRFPVRLERQRGLPTKQQRFLAHTIALSQYAPPALSWEGRFPSRLDAVRWPNETWRLGLTLALAQIPPPHLSWDGEYPTWLIPREKRQQPVLDVSSALQAAPAAPTLSWSGRWADPQRVIKQSTEAWRIGLTLALAQIQPPALSWSGVYPSWLVAPERRQQPSLDLSAALQAAPAPTLSWQGRYPTWLDARKVAQQPHLDHSAALRAALAPALSWKGWWPERLEPLRGLASAQQRATSPPQALAQFAVPPLTWQPTYTTQHLRVRTMEYGQWTLRWESLAAGIPAIGARLGQVTGATLAQSSTSTILPGPTDTALGVSGTSTTLPGPTDLDIAPSETDEN